MTSADGHRHVRFRRLAAAVAIASATVVIPTAVAHAISSPPLIVPCTGPHGGAAGLIAAIHKANRRGQPTTIELAAHCVYTLVKIDNNNAQGSNGLPVITGTIDILGNGATIFRAKKSAPYRILEVGGPPAALALDHVTISIHHWALLVAHSDRDVLISDWRGCVSGGFAGAGRVG